MFSTWNFYMKNVFKNILRECEKEVSQIPYNITVEDGIRYK